MSENDFSYLPFTYSLIRGIFKTLSNIYDGVFSKIING